MNLDQRSLGTVAPLPGSRRVPAGIGARSRRIWGAGVLVAVGWAAGASGVAGGDLVNPGGWPMVREFFAAALRPRLDAEFLRLTWDSAWTTVAYASLGTTLSVLAGLLFGVLVSQTWWGIEGAGTPARRRWGWFAARGVLGLPRGLHEVVWGLFLVNVLGLDPLVGILALAIPFGAITAKVFSELIDEAPAEPYRALTGAGTGRLKALVYGIGPQCLPDLLSYSFYRFECAIRGAALLGIIGAGGLGYQLSLSFSSLQYREMWTFIYALVLISGLADLWSTVLRRPRPAAAAPSEGPSGNGLHRSVLRNRLRPSGLRRRGLHRNRVMAWSAIGFVLLAGLSVRHLDVEVSNLWSERTTRLLGEMAGKAFPPAVSGEEAAELAGSAVQTVAMSIVAIAVSSAGAVGIAFLAAGRSRRMLPVAGAARTLLLFCRALPPPVWALLLLFVLFPGPLPGALALAAYNFGILGRLMAEVVENLDPRPQRALKAQGAGRAPAFAYGVLPLAVPKFAGFSLYRWEVTMREVVVVGLVGAGGLGRLLSEQLSSFDYPAVAATVATLILLTYLADLVGASLRRALR